MTRTALFLASALVAIGISSPTHAETLTAIVVDSGPEESYGPSLPETSIVDVDTATGEISNRQQLIGRGPGSFTAFERDPDGTLFGVTRNNILVTLDEETGEGSPVVSLSLEGASYFSVEGLAFVPGESGSTLFALVSTIFDGFGGREILLEEEEELPFYFLATVDLVSGELADTEFEIRGDHPFSEAHGIDYHPLLERIVHGFNEFSDPVIELIDPKTGDIDLAAEIGESTSPERFNGIACSPEGVVFVYDDYNSEIFRIDLALAELESEHGEVYEYYSEALFPTFIFEEEGPGDILFAPIEEYTVPNSLEINSDGFLVMEIEGSLRFFPSNSDFFEEEEFELPEEIPTSVAGEPLTPLCAAVHPLTGELFVLSMRDVQDEFDFYTNSPFGINIVDRGGAALLDVGKDEITLLPNMEEEEFDGPLLNFLSSIAFDSEGNLYGVNPYYGIVSIDIETGLVSISKDFFVSEEEAVVFHPSEKRFFIFTIDYDSLEEREKIAVVEFSESEESPEFDTDVLELSGDADLVEGFAHTATFWKNRLYFTASDSPPFLFGLGEGDETSQLYSLSLDGSVLRESTVEKRILSLAPPLIQVVPEELPDVLVGEPGQPLVGDNIYSSTGAGQAIQIKDKGSKLSGTFVSLIQNDGDAAGYFTISAAGGGGSDDIKYRLDGMNVTAAMRTGLMTYLPPGGAHYLNVKYGKDEGRRWNTSFHIMARTANAVDVGLVYSKLKEKRKKKRKKAPQDPRLSGF